jgi:hypothetical protein
MQTTEGRGDGKFVWRPVRVQHHIAPTFIAIPEDERHLWVVPLRAQAPQSDVIADASASLSQNNPSAK